MQAAEKKCRKLKLRNIPWSPEIAQAMLVKLAWCLIEKRLKGCKVGWKYLKWVLKKAGIPLEKRYVEVKEAEEAHKAAWKALKVAGRTSAFAYRDSDVDIQTLGEELGVRNVLEGSVRKQGDEIRITAQLVRTDNGYQLYRSKIAVATAGFTGHGFRGGDVIKYSFLPEAHSYQRFRGLDRGPRADVAQVRT